MQIAIDGRSLQDKQWTGVGYYTYNLLCAIFELDKDNKYTILYNSFGKINAPRFEKYENVSIVVSKWPNKLLNLSLRFFNYPKMNRKVKADLFFIPNLNFCSFEKETKIVTVAHDLYFEHFPEYVGKKTLLWHKLIKPRELFQRSDKIISVSEHTKNDLIEKYGIPEEKIKAIYPGVCSPVDCGWAKKNQTVKGYILYFGAIEPRKNINGLIEAYEMLKDPPGLVIAGCSGKYTNKIKKQVKESKKKDSIKIIENPDDNKKKELYEGAGLFVYPSFYEGFGFPPMEAMSAGVPVIASSASSVPEICKDAAMLVSPFNINEIKDGISILLCDDDLKKKYIQKGHERVKDFSWEICARGVLETFQD